MKNKAAIAANRSVLKGEVLGVGKEGRDLKGRDAKARNGVGRVSDTVPLLAKRKLRAVSSLRGTGGQTREETVRSKDVPFRAGRDQKPEYYELLQVYHDKRNSLFYSC